MNDITEIIASAASEDQEVRSRVKELAMRVLDEAEDIIDHGTPAIKTTLMRSFIPVLVREMGKKKDDDEIDELKRMMGVMMDEMRRGKGDEEEGGERVELEEDVPSGVLKFPKKVERNG